MANNPETRADAQATLGAFREVGSLGPEYEDAVVEAFLARLDSRLVDQEPPKLAPTFYPVKAAPREKLPANPSDGWTFGQLIAFISVVLGLAIPLTAIAASMLGIFGLITVWVGITTVVGAAAARGANKDKHRR